MFVKKPRVRRGSNPGASLSLLSSTYGSHRLHPFFLKWEEMVVEGGTIKESFPHAKSLLNVSTFLPLLYNTKLMHVRGVFFVCFKDTRDGSFLTSINKRSTLAVHKVKKYIKVSGQMLR